MRDDLTAILVTFNPDKIKVIKLINSLCEKCQSVIVVDNNSNDKAFLNSLPYSSRLKVVQLDENKGIAFAQNVGIDELKKSPTKFCLFLDQDSYPDESFYSSILLAYNELSTSSSKIILGPSLIDDVTGREFSGVIYDNNGRRHKINVNSDLNPKEVSLIISSVTFLTFDSLVDIGPMLSSLFIDFVDNEWCLRAKHKGYSIYVIASAIIKHSLGDKTIKFLNYNIPIHNSFRRYYKTRNSIWLFNYSYISKNLVVREVLTNAVHLFFNLVFTNNKCKQLSSFFKGVKDGLAGPNK